MLRTLGGFLAAIILIGAGTQVARPAEPPRPVVAPDPVPVAALAAPGEDPNAPKDPPGAMPGGGAPEGAPQGG